jgi:hypothetical protein
MVLDVQLINSLCLKRDDDGEMLAVLLQNLTRKRRGYWKMQIDMES